MPDDLRYIVRRFNWRSVPTVSEGVKFVRLPGAVVVDEFDHRDEAETYRWTAEQEVRRTVNPFRCGMDLADLTHIPGFAFRDYLLDDDVKPAKSDSYAKVRWDLWWEKQSSNWSDERKSRIWEALDKVRFHELIVRSEADTIHVVVEAISNRPEYAPYWMWERRPTYADWRQFGGTEGGRPVKAFRWRDDADACRQLLTEGADPEYPRTRNVPVEFLGPVRDVRKVPADQVFDVSLIDGNELIGGRIFVVCRFGFAVRDHQIPVAIETYTTGEVSWGDLSAHENFDIFPMRHFVREPRLVPEAAFVNRDAAEADAALRERVARRWLNPFLVRDPNRDGSIGSWAALGLAVNNSPRTEAWEQRAKWWSANIANADDALFDATWTAAVGEFRLHHIVEIELEG